MIVEQVQASSEGTGTWLRDSEDDSEDDSNILRSYIGIDVSESKRPQGKLRAPSPG